MKKCSKCKVEKEAIFFHKNVKTKDGLQYICKLCWAENARKWNRKNRDKFNTNKRKSHLKHKEKANKGRRDRSHTSQGIFFSLKTRAKTRNVSFNLSKEEFIGWYERVTKQCFYCDCPQTVAIKNHLFSKGTATLRLRLTVDRINPSLGYEIDNIVLACNLCNGLKSNILSLVEMKEIGVEMKEIGQKYIKPKWQTIVAEHN